LNDTIHIRDAFDELSKQHAELVFAFYGFAALVSDHITKGQPFDAKSLAHEYERLAEQAGEKLASLGDETSARNPHLQFLADTIRNVNKRAPLTLVTEDLIP